MKTYNIGPIVLSVEDSFVPPPLKGRNEWITALRSGKYKQCRSYLHYEDSYCCLGVKRELEGCVWSSKDNFNLKLDNGVSGSYTGYSGLDSLGTLPIGCYINGNNTMSLAGLNDHGLTFKQIAQIIEICWAES